MSNIKKRLENILLKIPEIWLPLDFIKWLVVDKLRYQMKKLRVSGFDITIGKTGTGKTLRLCKYAQEMRDKYKNELLISTNFYWKDEDFHLYTYKQISDIDYNKPIIFIIDEIQKEFKAKDYKNFPPELFDRVAEARKSNIRIVASSQYFRFIDNTFREYAHTITEMSNIGHKNRLFRAKTYDKDDWTRKEETKNNAYPPKIDILSNKWFIATDKIYSMYDTYKKTESIRGREYQEDKIFYTPNISINQPQILLGKKLLKI